MAEWSKATDCKSVEVFLRRFESCLSHFFFVDFREEIQAFVSAINLFELAHRAKLFLFFFWPCREVKLYRMLVREVGELLRSIDSQSISNPNENRSESLPAWLVVVGLPTRMRPPSFLSLSVEWSPPLPIGRVTALSLSLQSSPLTRPSPYRSSSANPVESAAPLYLSVERLQTSPSGRASLNLSFTVERL